MTTQPDLELSVEQADRDAAASTQEHFPQTAKAIRTGKHDHTQLVQAFARHRLRTRAATLEEAARIASYMQPHEDAREHQLWCDGFECATVAIAAAIRSKIDG